jgi:hypothetical protein
VADREKVVAVPVHGLAGDGCTVIAVLLYTSPEANQCCVAALLAGASA